MDWQGRVRAIAVVAALLGGLVYFVPGRPTYYVRVIDTVLIYLLLATGLNMVVGYAGLLDLGFVAFYAIGAYSYALLASGQFGIHLPFGLILFIGGGLAGIAGVLLGVPVLRLRGDYLAIVTLGFGEIIRLLMNNRPAFSLRLRAQDAARFLLSASASRHP
jgi:branched-chain amino acid transport system permease protein